jgi:uracil-DNA glycosylase
MKQTEADVLKDLRSALEFYRALGFERLPIKIRPAASNGKTSGKNRGSRCGEPKVRLSRISPVACDSACKEAALKFIREEIGDCKRCRLSGKRTNIVFGEGNPCARLMFIGEAPGREEDLQGRPFVGDAGTVLTRLINKMGFQREDVYIANIVKCRPPLNRDPEPDEIGVCTAFIERQIEVVSPEVIMSLGRISTMTLTGDVKLKITAVRGKFISYKGIPVMPTFHPAYLIRNPKDKWLTWNDAQKVLEKLGSTPVE